MKLRSKAVVLAAAGALTAVGATSALAMEHQFGGAFTVYTDFSNINGSRTGQDGYFPQGLEKKAPAANYIESRARLAYTAKANDDLKFVSMFELDYRYWGNSSYTTGRNQGGALGADTVNIETKNLYLDFNVAKNTNVKVGMQGFDDAFKGAFVGADMAGLLVTHSYSKATAAVGAFRWNDQSPLDAAFNYYPATGLGRQTRDFLVFDGKYDLNKQTKLGAAYYFMKDNTAGFDNSVHLLGINAETAAGPVTLDGFIAAQFGEAEVTQKDLSAFAASVGAKMKLGKGTMRGDFLYASGDDGKSTSKTHAWQSATNQFGLGEGGYYANEMVILGRDKNAFTNDNAIVYSVNNQNHGVIFAAAGYDLPLSDKMSCSANLGLAWNESSRTAVGDKNSNKFLGTEVNAELNYKLFESVSLSGRAAYVFLGDFFKDVAINGTPDNPYDVKLQVKYIF